MKKFFFHILSTAAGFLVALCLLAAIGLLFFVSSSSTPSAGNHALLKIDLTGRMVERTSSSAMPGFLGGASEQLSLSELLQSIHLAKTDERIKAIYIKAGLLSGEPACLHELRNALLDFRKSGKKVVAYADVYTQGSYYVCSAANCLAINPVGNLEWRGLAAEPMFLKDMLQKFGVRMQVFKVGTYKSAVEPYTETHMSEANRQQVTSYLGSIWSQMLNDVSRSRNIGTKDLQKMADENMTFRPAKELQGRHLVDTLLYEKEMEHYLCKLTGAKKTKEIDALSPCDVCLISQENASDTDNIIAVYYAFGDVVTSEVRGLASDACICSQDVIDNLDRLAKDKKIKAVVLRVNSGGGSAYASEQIWKAVKELRAKKPVVVSMSGMAASGAYYLSCGTDYIVADPTTLTGSIGIFGMFPDAGNLLTEKLGLHFDVVKTGKTADFGSISRPLNAEEQAMLQLYIRNGYNLFIKRVSEGRKLSPQAVDSIAQGRVWTGEQAIKKGLVNELGGLDTAIKRAAQRAKLEKESYTAVSYPAMKEWYEQLLDLSISARMSNKLELELGQYYRPFMWLKDLKQRDYIQARIPYEPNIH